MENQRFYLSYWVYENTLLINTLTLNTLNDVLQLLDSEFEGYDVQTSGLHSQGVLDLEYTNSLLEQINSFTHIVEVPNTAEQYYDKESVTGSTITDLILLYDIFQDYLEHTCNLD